MSPSRVSQERKKKESLEQARRSFENSRAVVLADQGKDLQVIEETKEEQTLLSIENTITESQD